MIEGTGLLIKGIGMNFRLSLQRAMTILVIAVSIYTSLQNLQSAKESGSLNEDPVTQWEERLKPLKDRLPFQRGVVGYLANSDIPGINYDPANESGEYTLAQYTLSPLIIVRGTNQEWTVGNLSREAFRVWEQSNNGQFEVVPLGNQIYLIHRPGK